LFFVAIQYAAQAGWSAPINRIPLLWANGYPIAGVLMLIIWFVAKGRSFPLDTSLIYMIQQSADYDKILDQKSVYFFWLGCWVDFPVLSTFCVW
jgi:hypothetical protein